VRAVPINWRRSGRHRHAFEARRRLPQRTGVADKSKDPARARAPGMAAGRRHGEDMKFLLETLSRYYERDSPSPPQIPAHHQVMESILPKRGLGSPRWAWDASEQRWPFQFQDLGQLLLGAVDRSFYRFHRDPEDFGGLGLGKAFDGG